MNSEALCRRGLRIPERFRWVHRWFARRHSFFWVPCVLCGRKWGGHEWRDIDGKSSEVYRNPEEPTTGTGICPKCTRAGKGETLPGVIRGEWGPVGGNGG